MPCYLAISLEYPTKPQILTNITTFFLFLYSDGWALLKEITNAHRLMPWKIHIINTICHSPYVLLVICLSSVPHIYNLLGLHIFFPFIILSWEKSVPYYNLSIPVLYSLPLPQSSCSINYLFSCIFKTTLLTGSFPTVFKYSQLLSIINTVFSHLSFCSHLSLTLEQWPNFLRGLPPLIMAIFFPLPCFPILFL